MSKIKVSLVNSPIKTPSDVKATVKALGLGKLNSYNEITLTPQIQGMLKKVGHLVKVENI